jgi:DNA mismatch repair protein MutL
MAKIRILHENLANQIAAGEVVERPASVIKELVENSIDAGARKISIEVELGGRRLMKIIDDGVGIPRDEATLALERHATSKLRTLADLESINTLGFRGEALASIASVSRLELVSKTEDEELATRVSTGNGTDLEIEDAARPAGTTITVKDLFHNTPARRKFLRSQPTENFHIASIVTHYALANPEIAFTLRNNGRESIRVSPARTLKERAYQLFGNEIIESLIPVSHDDNKFLKVSGYVSAPRERRTSRDSQYFFINGRFVRDRVVSAGLSEGYRAVLPHGVYPVAFLFLELPPEEVDVNVHPSKTEVRFRRAEAVKEIIGTSVKAALGKAGIGVTRDFISTRNPADADNRSSGLETIIDEPVNVDLDHPEKTLVPPPLDFQGTADISAPDNLIGFEQIEDQEPVPDDSEPQFNNALNNIYPQLPPVDSAYSIPKSVEPADLDPARISPIGQLHNSFIIASDDQGLLLIDQHVAHERILFDHFRQRETSRPLERQSLLIPETIDLNPAQSEALEDLKEQLDEYGFEVTAMSGRTLAIQTIPVDIPQAEAKNLISEILDTIDRDKRGRASLNIKDDIAASLACKAAVKINMELTHEKMRWMIDRLLLTSSPSTCPHGRPVVLRLTMKDIERRFHRT